MLYQPDHADAARCADEMSRQECYGVLKTIEPDYGEWCRNPCGEIVENRRSEVIYRGTTRAGRFISAAAVARTKNSRNRCLSERIP